MNERERDSIACYAHFHDACFLAVALLNYRAAKADKAINDRKSTLILPVDFSTGFAMHLSRRIFKVRILPQKQAGFILSSM